MSLKEQINKYYSDLWKTELGVSYNEAVAAYAEFNTPGIEPDFIFYYYFIKHFGIKKIVEVGSGLSTLFFQLVAMKLNISFVSFEEEQEYFVKTKSLLEKFNIHNNDNKLNLFSKNSVTAGYQIYTIQNCDFLFFDSSGDLRKSLLTSFGLLDSIPVLAVDDFDFLQEECADFVCHANRPKFYIYNGTGRLNRLQFINFKDIYMSDFREFIYQEPALRIK